MNQDRKRKTSTPSLRTTMSDEGHQGVSRILLELNCEGSTWKQGLQISS